MRSLYDGIQRFLDDVDPVILSRGQDYYRQGYVESVDYDNGLVTVEVSGSEVDPYLVEINFDEYGEVEAWECDCPYEWGPVCKHVVAALLAVQAEPPEERCQGEGAEEISIRDLVEQAEKEQLATLILEHCHEDMRFRSQVLSALEDSGEREFASIKELVEESIRSNSRYGYIDEKGCDNICTDLGDALDAARRRIERGQYNRALDIAQFVLLTGIRLIESDNGCLGWTIKGALETVELAAKGAAESGNERGELVQSLLKTAQDPVFDEWEDWRLDFLGRAAVLADAQNESEFERVLLQLSDRRWENFKDAGRYLEQDCFISYRIVCAVHGQAAGRAFLEENVVMDKFRLMLIQEYLEEGNYAGAEQLCRERVEREDAKRWRDSNRWDKLLYEIYRDWGQKEKQTEQAQKLALLGDRDFYQITKDLLTEAGRWEAEYPGFLAELKSRWSALAYMDVLAQENEIALLMEQVRVHRDAAFLYGNMLIPQYSEEIYDLCTAAIRREAERINNRRDYQMLCRRLCSLVDFGGTEAVQVLIRELRQAYPRRKALWEELEQVERRIEKRQKA